MTQSLSQQQQLQYLDAMGITLWTARYLLPNAEKIDGCDWPFTEKDENNAAPPSHRIQALLKAGEEALPAVEDPPKVDNPSQEFPAASAQRPLVSKLLDTAPTTGNSGVVAEKENSSSVGSFSKNTAVNGRRESLRFSFRSIRLGGGWWVISSGHGFDPQALALLNAVLASAGIKDRQPSRPVDFQWPMIEGLDVDDPEAEAKDGVLAFAASQLAQLSETPYLLLLAADDPNGQLIKSVLGINNGTSELINVPVILAPDIDHLLESAEAKRNLWRSLPMFNTEN